MDILTSVVDPGIASRFGKIRGKVNSFQTESKVSTLYVQKHLNLKIAKKNIEKLSSYISMGSIGTKKNEMIVTE